MIAFGAVNQTSRLAVTETGFTGTFTAVSNDTTIVTVTPGSSSGSSTATFTATSIGIGSNLSGTTSIIISDGKNVVTVPVTVSVTNATITSKRRL